MAEQLQPNILDRAGWRTPVRTDLDDERKAELREQRLMIAAAVAIGVLNILIVAAAVWHPASTFELTPLLPK
jgi:hypothetical protein